MIMKKPYWNHICWSYKVTFVCICKVTFGCNCKVFQKSTCVVECIYQCACRVLNVKIPHLIILYVLENSMLLKISSL